LDSQRGFGAVAAGSPRVSSLLPREETMVRWLLGLLIIIAIVLVLVKVAVAGGIVGAIALILLVLILLGRV
jgi:hypothetical protein